MSLHLSSSDYEALRRYAEEAYPDECCGILLGKIVADERHVEAVVACRNLQLDQPHKRYEIDPAEMVRVQREARENGLQIVGFYHSHPDHPAQPSPTDLVHAHWIGSSYVITSVVKGQAGETRSFLLSGTREEDKRFTDEDVIVE